MLARNAATLCDRKQANPWWQLPKREAEILQPLKVCKNLLEDCMQTIHTSSTAQGGGGSFRIGNL